jgi:hypothetical protein
MHVGKICVHGGSGNLALEVETDDCRLRNGEIAFPRQVAMQPPPPLPDWYSAPPGSWLRQSVDTQGRFEILSSRAAVDEVLAFYESCTARGGLRRSPETVAGRAVAGLGAENADYAFQIDLYRHNELTSATIQLLDRTAGSRNRIPQLRLLDRNDERVILQDTGAGEEYVAPASALTEYDPQQRIERYSRPREVESILWSSLPRWIQFGFEEASLGEVHRQGALNGEEIWEASILRQIDAADHLEVFEACLNNLDACGFDPSGVERLDRSYHVSVFQQGHSLNVHVRSEAGEGGTLTVLNTLGNVSALSRYSPPRKQEVAGQP